MASLVDYSIETLFFSFDHRDLQGPDLRLLENEALVNQYHKNIGELSLRTIEELSPKGKKLRFIISSLKMGRELERMSDQLVNILRSVDKIPGDYLPILRDMMKETSNMLRMATDAYILERPDLAFETIGNDKIVNGLNRKIIKTFLKSGGNKYTFAEGFHSTRMAKALERVGDHIKNIAEEVIFIEEETIQDYDFAKVKEAPSGGVKHETDFYR